MLKANTRRILAGAVVSAALAHATTIVVVRTPIDVSIAADSMATFGDGRTTTVCKIYQLGDVFLSVAGTDHDPVTNFNVAGIVSAAIKSGSSSPAEKIASVQSALRGAFKIEAQNLKTSRPNEFKEVRKNPVGVALIGFDHGASFVVAQQFSIVDGKQLDVVPSKPWLCPGTDCPAGVFELHMGKADELQKYTALHRSITDSADFARQLVQVEIDAHTKGVGAPIDVLRISANGPSWIQQKPGCPIGVPKR